MNFSFYEQFFFVLDSFKVRNSRTIKLYLKIILKKNSKNHNLYNMQDVLDLLVSAGEHQKRLFYNNFLTSNKVGEIICVQCDDSGDTYMFERWCVAGIDFIVGYRLMSEDSLIVADISYQVRAGAPTTRHALRALTCLSLLIAVPTYPIVRGQ